MRSRYEPAELQQRRGEARTVSAESVGPMYRPLYFVQPFEGKGRRRSDYRRQHERATKAWSQRESPWRRERPPQAAQEYDSLRRKRLLNQLRHREPDGRIGDSLLMYHLSRDDVDKLTEP